MADKPVRLGVGRECEIAALAEQLATTRFPAGRVEPEEIATQEGIAFRYAPFPEEFDGILMHDGGRFFIVCNDRRAPRGSVRSRFTFAHELGHYFLSDHRAALASGAWPAHYSRTEFTTATRVEREADLFAASLLLPGEFFRRAAADLGGTGFDRIGALASIFGVSLTATAYRALGLNLVSAPAAVFRWDSLGASIGRQMSEETARLRREYCALTEIVPPGTLTARAVTELSAGATHGHSHVMNWFPKLTGYDRGDQSMLREEVQSLGHHGWLTLIYADARLTRQ